MSRVEREKGRGKIGDAEIEGVEKKKSAPPFSPLLLPRPHARESLSFFPNAPPAEKESARARELIETRGNELLRAGARYEKEPKEKKKTKSREIEKRRDGVQVFFLSTHAASTTLHPPPFSFHLHIPHQTRPSPSSPWEAR